MLHNDPDIRVDFRTRHYMNWDRIGEHPKDLAEEDFELLFRERPHFARKFRPDASVLDAIDEKLGVAASEAVA